MSFDPLVWEKSWNWVHFLHLLRTIVFRILSKTFLTQPHCRSGNFGDFCPSTEPCSQTVPVSRSAVPIWTFFEIQKALSSDQIAKFQTGSPATQFYNDENGTINQLATAENNWNGCHPRNGFQNDLDDIFYLVISVKFHSETSQTHKVKTCPAVLKQSSVF